MGRGDKINIVASAVLQVEHHCGQLLTGYLLTATLMTDVKVLAEQTEQIAMGKENCTGAAVSDQRLLFAKMGVVAGYPCEFSGIADAGFAC